jgi:hypothetical protein
MLPVGCRLPEFEPDPVESESPSEPIAGFPVLDAQFRIVRRLVEELEKEWEPEAA